MYPSSRGVAEFIAANGAFGWAFFRSGKTIERQKTHFVTAGTIGAVTWFPFLESIGNG
jgi:hypothetical protein